MHTVSGPGRDKQAVNRRLDSWKEIAAFFGRDESTVKRWEKQRGLPVHRVPGNSGASVFAYPAELSAWLAGAGAGEAPVTEATVPLTSTAVLGRRKLWLAAPAVVLAAAAAFFAMKTVRSHTKPFQGAFINTSPNPQAQDLYLQGVYYWHQRTPQGLDHAVDYFTQAIVHDPNYAEAYVGLADCYNLLREYSLMPATEAYPRAKAAAERAIQLNEHSSGAHASLGFVDFYWSSDVSGALREFHRALELDPNSAQAHHWYANILMSLDRSREALEQIEIARKLDPQSRAVLADKGAILFVAGEQEESLALLKRLEAAEPDFLSPLRYLAVIYRARGDYRNYLLEAKKAARLLNDNNGLDLLDAAEKGLISGGDRGMLTALLQKQHELYSEGRESAYHVAETSAELGDKQATLGYLRQAFNRREGDMSGLLVNPAFRDLHNEPEFQNLLARMGLQPERRK